MTTEKTIDIQGIEPVILFGPYDSLLKKIKNEFSEMQITARGTQITIRGSRDGVALLEQIFSEMILLANKHGEVLDTDLNALINLALSPSPRPIASPMGDEDIIVTSPDYTVRADRKSVV